MTDKKNTIKYLMIKWCREMFPFNRSLTGDGTDRTFKYLTKINKQIKIIKFKSKQKVFDWEIPSVWNVKDAFIQDLVTKKKFCDLKVNNLHLVGYSINVNKIINTKDLLKKIYTHKNKTWIPYRTTYYKKDWGFCSSKIEKNKLKKKKYKVYINSKFSDGTLNIGEYYKKGKTKNEIFFSTYICHPSMANNELSGPVVSSALINYIKNQKTNYSYRFVFLPETIGSIAYLSLRKKILKKNVISGFNLSCVGDNRAYSIIKTKKINTISNQALYSATRGLKKIKIYDYLYSASDERQYNSPGIDLPVAGFCRSKYKSYPEYHTSADNFNVVTKEGLYGSYQVLKKVIDAFETELYPLTKIFCEPFLSKRNLYPSLSGDFLKANIINRKNILKYCDGKTNIFEISNILNISLSEIINHLKILKLNKIIY